MKLASTSVLVSRMKLLRMDMILSVDRLGSHLYVLLFHSTSTIRLLAVVYVILFGKGAGHSCHLEVNSFQYKSIITPSTFSFNNPFKLDNESLLYPSDSKNELKDTPENPTRSIGIGLDTSRCDRMAFCNVSFTAGPFDIENGKIDPTENDKNKLKANNRLVIVYFSFGIGL